MELNDDQILIDEKYLYQTLNNINYPVSSLNPTSNLLLTKQQIININPYMDITSDVNQNQYVKRSLCEQFILNKINIQCKFPTEHGGGSLGNNSIDNIEIISPANLEMQDFCGNVDNSESFNKFISSELYKTYFLSNTYNYTIPAKIVKDYKGNYVFDDIYGPFSLIPTTKINKVSGNISSITTIDINKPVNISDHLALYMGNTPSNYDYLDYDPIGKITEHGGSIIIGIAKINYTAPNGYKGTTYVLMQIGYELQYDEIMLNIYSDENITNFINVAVDINIRLNVELMSFNVWPG